MKTALNVFVMIVGTFIMLSCTEAPELLPNPGPNPGPTGPKLTLTDEERMAVLNECSQKVELIGDLKQEANQQALVAWLKTRPEFVDAGAEEGSVWANFHDGRMAIFAPNWLGADEDTGGRAATTPSGGRIDASSSSGRTQGIPGSNKVELYLGLGKAFLPDRRPDIKSFFDRSHTEYDVVLKDATVENLKQVRNLGIFYINTHGGLGYVHPRSDNIRVFALYTTDHTSVAGERNHLADLNSGLLVYMHATFDNANPEWHYAISHKWVSYINTIGEEYMSFAKDALFYIDACNGMSANAEKFREALIGKTANQKGTYIGWTAPMSATAAGPAARFIFDRLLGVHDRNVPMEDPVQRPFDWPRIFDDMRSYVVNPPLGVSIHGGKLDYFSVHTSEPILTPSIEYIWMADFESLMFIKGMFGEPTDVGKVTVAGQEASIEVWTKDLIIAEIPIDGPGSHGDVIVSVRGNESNKVPLTEWTIPLNVSTDDVGATTEAILKLKIRADVHRYRTKPGEAPRTERPETPLPSVPNPSPLGYIFHTASTGTYSFAGPRSVNCIIDDCTLNDKETMASRSGLLPYLPLAAGLGFRAFYKWSADMTKIYVNLSVEVPHISSTMVTYTSCPKADPITLSDDNFTDLRVEIPTQGIPHLEFKLDENYRILPDQIEKTRNVNWGRCPGQAKITTKAVWSGANPVSPPKSDTDARIGRQVN